MRKLTKLITLLLFTVLSSQIFAQGDYVSCTGRLQTKGSKIVGDKGVPVQLRGMSLFWSQWSDGDKFYNKDIVKWFRDDWNCNIIRCAMAVGSGGYLTNPDVEKAKIKTVVQACIDNGLYVIIDWHSHTAENEKAKAIEFFSEMARLYGSYPNVIYEIYNEPLNGTSWSQTIKPYAIDVIKAIRAEDPDNLIIVGTRSWSQEVLEAADDPIVDNNVAYTLHFYADTHKQWLRDKTQAAINKGAAIFVTEYGTCRSDGAGVVNEAETKLWWKFLDDNQISHCNWSVSDKNEAASVLLPGASSTGGWTEANLSTSGKLVRAEIKAKYTAPICSDTAKILRNPSDVLMNENATASLTVLASGVDLKYQWYQNDSKIDGATSSEYTIISGSEADMGKYYVMVSNDLDTVYSTMANVRVLLKGSYFGTPSIIPGVIQAEHYDVGSKNETFYDLSSGNIGGKLRTDDVDIRVTTDVDGEYSVNWIDSQEWLLYTVEVEKAGFYDFSFRYNNPESVASKVVVAFNGLVTVSPTLLDPTSSATTWKTVTAKKVELNAGVQKIKVLFTVGGAELNYINVTSWDSTGTGTGTGISSDIESIGLTVYPNPSTDLLHISSTNQRLTGRMVEVLDLQGIQILSTQLENSGADIQVDNLKPGVYILKFPVDGRIYYHKWVKQ